MMTCKNCGETKPLEKFSNQRSNRSGKSLVCRTCILHKQQVRRRKQRAADRIENNKRRNKWKKFSEAEVEVLAKAQGYRCLICRKKKPLIQDHCHTQFIFRGLICASCNTMLGFAYDNVKTLKRAIRYLQKHEQTI